MSRLDDGKLLLAYPVSELGEGAHSLELVVVTNGGKSTRSSIEFVASNRAITPEIYIDETPARLSATIDISIQSPSMSRLIISDVNGETIFTKANPSFPFTWDLKDAAGKDVPDGLYKVAVLVQSGADYGSTPHARLTVLR